MRDLTRGAYILVREEGNTVKSVGVCERGVRRTWKVGLEVAIFERVCNNSPAEFP
ncbi:hypothetical protein NIES4103_04960 [Nostoc sp. NIES-4103]|nr:hypothetical protein NIES4103_04960 [Nostoc sp. NIES-4103]